MKFNYLVEIKTVEMLKRMYRHFAVILHPDCGGSNEAMKQLNAEYDYWLKKVGNIHESTKGEEETYTTNINEEDLDDGFRDIINEIAYLINKGVIFAELCGSWIWISGNTKDYKDILKKVGFFWSPKKKMWYWHSKDQKRKFYKNSKSIEEIRAIYGSKKISAEEERLMLKGARA